MRAPSKQEEGVQNYRKRNGVASGENRNGRENCESTMRNTPFVLPCDNENVVRETVRKKDEVEIKEIAIINIRRKR